MPVFIAMKKGMWIPVLTVSTLLLLYCLLVFGGKTSGFTAVIFSFSPLLMVWMVYSVICNGEYKGRELKPDEEFGYTDKL